MNRGWRFVALGAGPLSLAALLAGCGSYDKPTPASGGAAGSGTAGASGSGAAGTSGAGTAGSVSTAGSAGSAGSGTAGSGGQAGSAGSAGQGTCTNVTACGGDAQGNWSVSSACLTVSGVLDPGVLQLNCSAPPVTGSLQVTGSWMAASDGSYMDNTTTTGTETITLESACKFLSGTTFECAQLSNPMRAYGYSMVDCVDAAGGSCTCTATVDQAGGLALVSTNASPSGVYTSVNNTLTITSGQDDTLYPYCITGSTLSLSLQGAGKTGTVTGTVVLQKQ